jgi:acyl-CoA thioester hydrolase
MSDAPIGPVTPEFRLRVHARPEDNDELQHVSNLVYLRWVLDIALAHSEAVGWTHAAYVAAGHVFVVRRHEIEYLTSALEGDEIELVTWIESWTAATSVRRTRLLRVRDGKLLATASTIWALVAMDTGRPKRIPVSMMDDFRLAAPRADGV